jgi:RNase H-like domain found in reverse transcriptase/Integrase zinc binding domain
LDLLRRCQKDSGATKLKLRKHHLAQVWGNTLERDFQNLRKTIVDRMTLSHPDPSQCLVLHTDVSQAYFAGILTQTTKEDNDTDNQRHEPLAFVSGRFSGPSLNWSVPEKEAHAILFAITRLRYLTLVNTVNIFTHHKSSVYIYDPKFTNSNVTSYIVSKLTRWVIILSEFDYVVYHIVVEANYFADLMTRWAATRNMRLAMAPLLTPEPDVNESHLFELVEAPQSDMAAAEKRRPELMRHEGLYRQAGRVYVPRSAVDVKLRLLIVTHCGRAGQKPYEETKRKVLDTFVWDGLTEDVEIFVWECIHCQSTNGPHRIPRPWMQTLHAEKPNQLLHVDFLFVGSSIPGEQ